VSNSAIRLDFRISRRIALWTFGLGALAALAGAPARANPIEFRTWVRALRREAMSRGISARTFDAAMAEVPQPVERVLELDRRQPEQTLTFPEYLARVVTPQRIETGIARYRENLALLNRVAAQYNVQPRFIVALWGIESGYGQFTGGFNVFAALATLAYDGRRASFFRDELLKALRIAERNRVAPRTMRGSWAGAMGQCQFMPSSYLNFAVDFDGDGRADIWQSLPDVFASIANYLARSGWRGDETWGREVVLPPGFDPNQIEYTRITRSPAEWQAMGVRRADGGPMPEGPPAGLVQPDGDGGPTFFAYPNFRVIMRWNRSFRFAIAAGTLADSIAAG
jgi:membrane-bound lytic murein transglycosylase B